ncbi:MAG: precorrin-3B C(17)-methyltransferase [Muribaculaceae bacterium]|nr:precorrin-3B C(17)-methyltransferase [Muribaculaceae bacterium]
MGITVVGIGPGSASQMTAAAVEALSRADAVVGYKYYLPYVEPLLKPGTEIIGSAMKQERERVEAAFEAAMRGLEVCIVSSGDAGIYGMAPLVMEMRAERHIDIDVTVIPGVSAFQTAASLLGSPISHDFCAISLSDLMTPWSVIERRILGAAGADFVTAVYNPISTKRYWQLPRLVEIFLQHRSPDTPVGCVRQAGRDGQKVWTTTLSSLNPVDIDMFTVIIIGNSQTYVDNGVMITPRGYYGPTHNEEINIGQQIMIKSFRTIESEMRHPDIPLDLKWAMLHAIHTTADFDMENIVKADPDALLKIYTTLSSGAERVIVTDVTMAASGIRKGALERLSLEVKCYLNHPDTAEMARRLGITRTQAGIRLAVEEHPGALYVFGNAPTALQELCSLMRSGKAKPCGIVAAPVGFVHVCESKHAVKTFRDIPKIIVEGRKGGSNLAATLVNAILCRPDAQQLKPGRDV